MKVSRRHRRRDDRPTIVVFLIAAFVLGALNGALITDHAWKTQTSQTQEAQTP
ncbi:hypothetical protein ABZ330_16750 [Streptomyces sp. NPDC006172]|uniref:hypothetical protein n=1 Tax=Streptomyces sp. NPDC006172 TaxID=3154470 RepID=UPI00340C8331